MRSVARMDLDMIPIFFLPEKGKTTAELDPEEKNEISHRGNALRLMKDVIRKHRENN